MPGLQENGTQQKSYGSHLKCKSCVTLQIQVVGRDSTDLRGVSHDVFLHSVAGCLDVVVLIQSHCLIKLCN